MAKIITVAQQKGGAGKSTLAAHLAIGLTQRNFKVALIDVDPQGSLTKWFEIRSKLFGSDYTGISFTSCSGIRVTNEINQRKMQVDFIIIDCPPHTQTEAKTAIRAADLVLIPMQPSPTDIWASYATIDFSNEEKKPIKIVMNRYNPTTKLAKNIELPNDYVCKAYLGNRTSFASSLAHGKTVLETEPKSLAATEIKSLISELLINFNI